MTKSTKWFLIILSVFCVIVIAFSILLIGFLSSLGEGTEYVTKGSGAKVAVVELKGVITESETIIRQLRRHRDDRSIKAIVLRVDSPGGGAVASQEMYEEVRKTRDVKPVVVSMAAIAASGGYYVSCGATRIVANQGTLTGSIGVISEFLQLRDLLDKIGIDIKTIKSGRFKDSGTMNRKMTPAEEKYFQALMDDVHDQFIAVVEEERGLTHEEVLAIADGRVFTGRQAMTLGLVDTLGTFEDAVDVAAELGGIEGDPALVRERARRSFMDRMFGDMADELAGVAKELLSRPILSYRYTSP